MTPEQERETRRRRIDPRLKAAGWRVVPFRAGASLSEYGSAAAVEEFETTSGPADYALCDNGKVLGVVEAKKLTLGPAGVLPQAERYSIGLAAEDALPYEGGFRAPFLYSTNGEILRFRDARHPLNLSREIPAFHTPAALRELLDRDLDSDLRSLSEIPGERIGLEVESRSARTLPANRRYLPPPQRKHTPGSMTGRIRREVILGLRKP